MPAHTQAQTGDFLADVAEYEQAWDRIDAVVVGVFEDLADKSVVQPGQDGDADQCGAGE